MQTAGRLENEGFLGNLIYTMSANREPFVRLHPSYAGDERIVSLVGDYEYFSSSQAGEEIVLRPTDKLVDLVTERFQVGGDLETHVNAPGFTGFNSVARTSTQRKQTSVMRTVLSAHLNAARAIRRAVFGAPRA